MQSVVRNLVLEFSVSVSRHCEAAICSFAKISPERLAQLKSGQQPTATEARALSMALEKPIGKLWRWLP